MVVNEHTCQSHFNMPTGRTSNAMRKSVSKRKGSTASKKKRCTHKKTGSGIIGSITGLNLGSLVGSAINKAVDLLPGEVHLPGYNYCGPGTKLAERLARGDIGINKLDEACKQHDIAYTKYSDTTRRAQADKELAERAWERVTSSDASIGEKAAAWAVTNLMKVKSKLGGGCELKTRGTVEKQAKGLHLRPYGKGLYLRPYKKGSGIEVKSKKKPNRQRRRKQ